MRPIEEIYIVYYELVDFHDSLIDEKENRKRGRFPYNKLLELRSTYGDYFNLSEAWGADPKAIKYKKSLRKFLKVLLQAEDLLFEFQLKTGYNS